MHIHLPSRRPCPGGQYPTGRSPECPSSHTPPRSCGVCLDLCCQVRPPDARATWPCHLSLRDLSNEVISSSPSLSRRAAEGVSSRSLTPHIQRIIALSVCLKRCMSVEVGAQVSLPWSRAERTQALNTLPRVRGNKCLEVRMGRSFLNFPQAALHLAIIACEQPHSAHLQGSRTHFLRPTRSYPPECQ